MPRCSQTVQTERDACWSSMSSKPPRIKATALTHNEEYCTVAIHNPLTCPGAHPATVICPQLTAIFSQNVQEAKHEEFFLMTALRGRFGWADLPLWSHREEERRQLLKPNRWRVLPRPRRAPSSARQRGANEHARTENSSKCQQCLRDRQKRDSWREARLLCEKALEKEETARRMEEQKKEQGLQSATGTSPPTGACAHAPSDGRPSEQARSRSRVSLTDVRGSSEQCRGSKQRHSSRGSADKPNKRLFCCW